MGNWVDKDWVTCHNFHRICWMVWWDMLEFLMIFWKLFLNHDMCLLFFIHDKSKMSFFHSVSVLVDRGQQERLPEYHFPSVPSQLIWDSLYSQHWYTSFWLFPLWSGKLDKLAPFFGPHFVNSKINVIFHPSGDFVCSLSNSWSSPSMTCLFCHKMRCVYW